MPDSPVPYPVLVRNDSGEEIPAFGCMQITGAADVNDRTFLTVTKPTTIDGEYIFNHNRTIAAGESGMALPWGVVKMLGSVASPARLNPVVGAWTVAEAAEDEDSQFVGYGADATLAGTIKGRIVKEKVESTAGEVIFRFETSDYDEERPENCDEQSPTDAASFRVKVIGMPCGQGTVPGSDEDNFITVYDTLGWLEGRDDRDLPGRIGVAGRFGMLSDYGDAVGECKWVIKTINMFRARVNVTEVIDETTQITIRTERQVVWDHCMLPDEVIVTTECPDDEYA